MSSEFKQFKIRMDPGLHLRLTEFAAHNGRSVSAELIQRVEQSFEPPQFVADSLPCQRDRRERIATAVMQGLLSNGFDMKPFGAGSTLVVRSVVIADCMIAELDQPPESDDESRSEVATRASQDD